MEKLKKISLSISLLGIFLLLFISNIESLKLTEINQINDNLLNKKIKVEGEINKIRNINNNFQIISLIEKEPSSDNKDKNKKIDALANKQLNVKEGDFIQVIGRVTEYNGTLQIQSDKIIFLNYTL